MDYQQALTYINSISLFGIELGLERMRELLRRLGNPQQQLRCIHIAGTNGKGSACAMLQSILKEAGYRTGMYTSPHLVTYNERYQINGIPISDTDFAAELTLIKKHCDAMQADGWHLPTVFEQLTALAFHYFVRVSVDIVLLEVGLGGKFDATNVIQKPLLSLIMSIGMDHMEYLGNSTTEIAVEKAGIIKENCPVVLYPQENLVYNKIKEICEQKNAPLYDQQTEVHTTILSQNLEKTVFSVETPFLQYDLIDIRLLGYYQIKNCATVLLACHVLTQQGVSLTKEQIVSGLQHATWQGRMEKIASSPLVLLDGAHNQDGIAMLAHSIQTYCKDKKITLLLGVLQDKEYEKMAETLLPLVDTIVLTEPISDRKLTIDRLEQVIASFGKPIYKNASIPEAYRLALSFTASQDALLCCGSLYMIGALRNYISNSEVL